MRRSRTSGAWVQTLAWAGLVVLLASGCGSRESASGPTVLEIAGRKIRLAELRREYDMRHEEGAFDRLAAEQRRVFLQTIGDKEVLIELAREGLGSLDTASLRRLRQARDARLLKALDAELVARAAWDTSSTVDIWSRLNQEMRFSWLKNPSDSIVALAREQVASGRSFAEVARQYSTDDSTRAKGGILDFWMTADRLDPEYADELFLRDRTPGYLSTVRGTIRGHELFRIDEVRPVDVLKKPGRAEALPLQIQSIRSIRVQQGVDDSLRQANSLAIIDEALPLLRAKVRSVLDSLQAGSPGGGGAPAANGLPPLRLTPDERNVALYRLRGQTHSLGEFADSLLQAPAEQWPTGSTLSLVRRQVEQFLVVELRLDLARQKRLDRSPRYLWECRTDEEKLWIDAFNREMVASTLTITPEEIQAYYEAHLNSYTRGDKVRFSYVVFPTRKEAQAHHDRAARENDMWWTYRLSDFLKDRPDVKVVANTELYDYTATMPEEVKGLAELARDREVLNIVGPASAGGTGWAVAMITQRERPGVMPLGEAEPSIRMALSSEKIDREVGQRVSQGKTRLGLKLYPERLGGTK